MWPISVLHQSGARSGLTTLVHLGHKRVLKLELPPPLMLTRRVVFLFLLLVAVWWCSTEK